MSTPLYTFDLPNERMAPGTRVLGCFTLERYLGEGSFATVYLARQDGTDRRAVIKVAHRSILERPDSATFMDLFLQEFRAASSIHHPNVATVYLTGTTDDGLPAIAMEYVEGYTLSHILNRYSNFSARVVLHMWSQLANALEAIHAAGVIHRDLSPENVLVARQPHTQQLAFKIVDFGLSAPPSPVQDSHLGAIGTPRYMALEQYHLQPAPASDIYALGCLLWWALTGKELLAHLHTLVDVHHHFKNISPQQPDTSAVQHIIGQPLARLLAQMLDPDHRRRPQAREIVKTLPLLATNGTPVKTSQSILPNTPESLSRSRPGGAGSTLSTELPILSHLQRRAVEAPASMQAQRHSTQPEAPAVAYNTSPAIRTETPAHGEQLIDAASIGRLAPFQRRQLIERFMGQMPSWLIDMEEAVERSDRQQVRNIGALIQRAARDLGALPLEQAAATLVNSSPYSAEQRLQEVHQAYQITFRALLPIHHSIR